MGAYLADALRRRLARQEADGDKEGAAVTRKRLKTAEAAEVDVENEPAPKAKPETVEVVDEPKAKSGPKPKEK